MDDPKANGPESAVPASASGGCPNCGSKRAKKVSPVTQFAYVKDRICLDCQTRYSPPTPQWAALVFILAGCVLFLPGLGLVIVAIVWEDLEPAKVGAIVGSLGLPAVLFGFRRLIARQQTVIVTSSPPEPVDYEHDYRLAYRVLDDHRTDPCRTIFPTLLGFGVLGLAVLVLVVIFTEPEYVLVRLVGVAITMAFLMVLYLLCWYPMNVRSYRKHLLCQQWFQSNDFEIAEGKTELKSSGNLLVSDSQIDRRICLVGSEHFEWSTNKHYPGFRGEFTAENSPASELGSELQVRVAHRNGYLLQIEIVPEKEWVLKKTSSKKRKKKKRR